MKKIIQPYLVMSYYKNGIAVLIIVFYLLSIKKCYLNHLYHFLILIKKLIHQENNLQKESAPIQLLLDVIKKILQDY